MTNGSGCPPEGLMPAGTPVGDPAAMTDEHPHAIEGDDFDRYCVECTHHRHWMGRCGKEHVCLVEGFQGLMFRNPVLGIDETPPFINVVDVQGESQHTSNGEKMWLPLCYRINFRAECTWWEPLPAESDVSQLAEVLDDMKTRGAALQRELGLLCDGNHELRQQNFEMVKRLNAIAAAATLSIKGADNGQSQKTTAS